MYKKTVKLFNALFSSAVHHLCHALRVRTINVLIAPPENRPSSIALFWCEDAAVLLQKSAQTPIR